MSLAIRGTVSTILISLILAAMAANAANHNVSVGGAGFVFMDSETATNVTNIAAGDTVTFTNTGGFHNAESDPGTVTAFRCANGCDATGGDGAPSSTLWTAVVTFPAPGTIGYHCFVHGAPGQAMFGTINVTVPVDLQSFEID